MFPFKNKTLIYEQKAVGQEQLFITESVDDATMATQAGFPAISLDAGLMREENLKDLIEIATKSKTIFIVNTTNDPKRIACIGKALALQGLPVFVLALPSSPGSSGVSGFLKAHKPEDFRKLAEAAPAFLSILISQLPIDFRKAAVHIKEKILPLLKKLDPATAHHYMDALAKQVHTKMKIIQEMMQGQNAVGSATSEIEDEKIDPEIRAEAEALKKEPQLCKLRIDAVNKAVVGERKNIAVFFAALDSRLIKDSCIPGQNVLAVKNSGHYGAGKSYTLLNCLAFYPKDAYQTITTGSEKSLYYLESDLRHKCLVVMEGFQFSGERGDSEIALIVRSLLSEGRIVRLVPEKNEDGRIVTREIIMEGPTSFITTTILDSLEAQLEDRMFTIHPNETSAQTEKIIEKSGDQASGGITQVANNGIKIWKVWQVFHSLLEPISVVIPYAPEIASHVKKIRPLPIATRWAFIKILNVIQAVACLYQFQRGRDEYGRVIAEIADYRMASQIVAKAFAENLGRMSETTGERLKYIEDQQHVSVKDLASHSGVSRPTISSWAKGCEENGLVHWVDEQDKDFPDENSLKKAKRTGKAHLKVTDTGSQGGPNMGLPAPSELMDDDPNWKEGGAQYQFYDLELNPSPSAKSNIPGIHDAATQNKIEASAPPKKPGFPFPSGKAKPVAIQPEEPEPEEPPSGDLEDPDGNPLN